MEFKKREQALSRLNIPDNITMKRSLVSQKSQSHILRMSNQPPIFDRTI